MQNKLFKKIALVMSFITMLGTLPVNAYDIDEQGMSIENVEYQTSADEDFSNETNVFAEIGSVFTVTIPKVIVLSGHTKSAEYKVSAEGDIAGYETIFVRPDRIVNLYSVNKDMQVGTITQDKTGWTYSTIDEIGNGLIKADGITAGKWSGTFNFEIFLNKVLGDVIAPDHEHNPGEAQIENLIKPDCVNTGSYDEVFYCTDCYKELSREEKSIPANGHTPGSVVEENRVEPTCVLNGSYDEVTYCTVCGEELSRTQVKIPFLGHNFVDYVCTRCGIDEHEHTCAEVLIENEIEPMDGNPGSHEEVYICDICGLEYLRKTVYVPIETEFAYTGNVQTYTVPYDGLYKLEVWGAQGGNSNSGVGGSGGYSMGYKEFTAGDIIYVVVGGQGESAKPLSAGGYNGGGSGYGVNYATNAGGGGATHMAKVTGTLAQIGKASFIDQGNGLIVAGGGGGGNQHWNGYTGYGGAGGGLTGGDGSITNDNNAGLFGLGGSQTAGGLAKYGLGGNTTIQGAFGRGGNGNSTGEFRHGASGGGGGLYGGGGGIAEGYPSHAPGGGGSGYIGGVPELTYNGDTYTPVTQNGGNGGNGKAKISFISK